MQTASIYDKKLRPFDMLIHAIIYFCASISIIILAVIVGYVTVRGISSVNWSFLTNVPSTLRGTFGIAGNIVNHLVHYYNYLNHSDSFGLWEQQFT